MALARKIDLALVVFLFCFSLGSWASSWHSEINKINSEEIIMVFSEELAVERLILPAVSEELWGKGLRCRSVVAKIKDETFLASSAKDENQILFEFDGKFCTEIKIKAIYKEAVSEEQATEGNYRVTAVTADVRRIEVEISRLASETIAFQQQNNCFSCHTAFPLAILINEADKRGVRVSQSQIENFSENIVSFQNFSGEYHFVREPDYGTISPTLCAGAIFSTLVRFDKRLLVNLNRIFRLLPGWVKDSGELKSDFYFKPLFVGDATSVLFESMIVSALYYFEPSVTEKKPADYMLDRLLFLGKKNKVEFETAIGRKLILFAGLPYIGQFNWNDFNSIVRLLERFFAEEPKAKNAALLGLAGLFFDRILDEKNLKSIAVNFRSLETRKISEQIWECLVQVLLVEQ
jgi:hypothetical protein